MTGNASQDQVYVNVGDSSTTPEGMLYYELAEPIELDLSAPLTLKVGHGGSLRMTYANTPNAQGTIALTKHADFDSVEGCEVEMA